MCKSLRIEIWCIIHVFFFLTTGTLNRSITTEGVETDFAFDASKDYSPPLSDCESEQEIEYDDEKQSRESLPIQNDYLRSEREERDLPDYGDYQMEKDLPDLGKAGLRMFSWWKSSEVKKRKNDSSGGINSNPTNRLLAPDNASTVLPTQSPLPNANAVQNSSTISPNTTVNAGQNAGNSTANMTTTASTASTYLTTCYTITDTCLPLLTLVAAPICTESNASSTTSPSTVVTNVTNANLNATGSVVAQSTLNASGITTPITPSAAGPATRQAIVQLGQQSVTDSDSLINGPVVVPVYKMPPHTQLIMLNTPAIHESPSSVSANEVINEKLTNSFNNKQDSTKNFSVYEPIIMNNNQQKDSHDMTLFTDPAELFTSSLNIYFPNNELFNSAFLYKIPEDRIVSTQPTQALGPNIVMFGQGKNSINKQEQSSIKDQGHLLNSTTYQLNADLPVPNYNKILDIQMNSRKDIDQYNARQINERISKNVDQPTISENLKGNLQISKLNKNQFQVNNYDKQNIKNNVDEISTENLTNNQKYYNNLVKYNSLSKLKNEKPLNSLKNGKEVLREINNENPLLKSQNIVNPQSKVKSIPVNEINQPQIDGIGTKIVNNLNETSKIYKFRNELFELKKDSNQNSKVVPVDKSLKGLKTDINTSKGLNLDQFNNSIPGGLTNQELKLCMNINKEKYSNASNPQSDYNSQQMIDQKVGINFSNPLNGPLPKVNPMQTVTQTYSFQLGPNFGSTKSSSTAVFEKLNENYKYENPSFSEMNIGGPLQVTNSLQTSDIVNDFGYNVTTIAIEDNKMTGPQKCDVPNLSENVNQNCPVGHHYKYNDSILTQHSTSGQNLVEICKNITCQGNDYLAQCCGSRICSPGKCHGEDFSYLHPIPGDTTTTSVKPCPSCRDRNNKTLTKFNSIPKNSSVRVARENTINDFIRFQLMHGIGSPDSNDLINALKEAKYQVDKVKKEFHPDSSVFIDNKQSSVNEKQTFSKNVPRSAPSIIDTSKILENLRATMSESLMHSKLPAQHDKFRPIHNQGFIENRDDLRGYQILNKLREEADTELRRIFELERRHRQEEELFSKERDESIKELKSIRELINKEYENHPFPDLKRRGILNFPGYIPSLNDEDASRKKETYTKLVNEIGNSDNNNDNKDLIFDRYSKIKNNTSEIHNKPQSDYVGVLIDDNNQFPELDYKKDTKENNENPFTIIKLENDNATPFKGKARSKRENSMNKEDTKKRSNDEIVQNFDSLHGDLFDLQKFVASRILEKRDPPLQVKQVELTPNQINNVSYYLMGT